MVRVSSPPQSWSKAVVCVSTPRMYPRSGYFLVIIIAKNEKESLFDNFFQHGAFNSPFFLRVIHLKTSTVPSGRGLVLKIVVKTVDMESVKKFSKSANFNWNGQPLTSCVLLLYFYILLIWRKKMLQRFHSFFEEDIKVHTQRSLSPQGPS